MAPKKSLSVVASEKSEYNFTFFTSKYNFPRNYKFEPIFIGYHKLLTCFLYGRRSWCITRITEMVIDHGCILKSNSRITSRDYLSESRNCTKNHKVDERIITGMPLFNQSELNRGTMRYFSKFVSSQHTVMRTSTLKAISHILKHRHSMIVWHIKIMCDREMRKTSYLFTSISYLSRTAPHSVLRTVIFRIPNEIILYADPNGFGFVSNLSRI